MCKKCRIGLFIVLAIILLSLMSANVKSNNGSMKSVNMCSLIISDSLQEPDSLALQYHDTIEINRATRYNPSVTQCDDTPFNTADGSFIDTASLRNKEIRWCALSWDLVYDDYRQKVRGEDWAWRGDFMFGDTIYVESESKPFVNGYWVVHDVMNSRYRKSIDFLVHKSNMTPRLGVCKDLVIIKM